MVVPPFTLLPEMVPSVAPLTVWSGQTNTSVGAALGATLGPALGAALGEDVSRPTKVNVAMAESVTPLPSAITYSNVIVAVWLPFNESN